MLLARHLLVTPVIHGVLSDNPRTPHFPTSCAIEVMGWFVRGYLMRSALRYQGGYPRGMEPVLERLDDVDEVWAMCFRKPPPGWRLLGRFVETGTFVALGCYDRHAMAPREKYMAAAQATIVDWVAMFGKQQPHRGMTLEEYIGGVVVDANEKD